MPASDLALLIETAREAGEIALHHRREGFQTHDKPGEGPVTGADLAVDRHLRARLTAARPDYGWLSEETPDTPDRLSRTRLFVVDPIDGTRAFIAGHRDWCPSLAVVENGRPVAAVVILPDRDQLYAAALGQGASLNGQPIRVSGRASLADADLLAPKAAFEPGHWRAGPPPARRHFRSSLARRMCLIAEGRFDAMLTLRPAWEWDIAAGTLIVAEAGGHVTDAAGRPLGFNGPAAKVPSVVAGGAVHPALLAALAEQ